MNAWALQISSAFLDLCSSSEAYYLFTFPVMFDIILGKFDGGHLLSSGGFSFADFFSSIICLRAMAISLLTLTSTSWLMEASPQEKNRAPRTF